MNVFTYGSLMFPEVWNRVVRGRYPGEPATLYGYQRLKIRGASFPALWPGAASECVSGVVYRGVNASDLERLDEFEGDYYERRVVTCHLASGEEPAAVYLFLAAHAHLLRKEAWDPEWFERVGIHAFIERYERYL